MELGKPETYQSPSGVPPAPHIFLATSLLDVPHSCSTLATFLYGLGETVLH